MIKIIHIISDSNIGGAGVHLLGILKNIDRTSFDVAVLVPTGAALCPKLKEMGVRTLEVKHGLGRSTDFFGIGEICRILRREKPDIVHTHASVTGRVSSFVCGVPIRIMTRHCPVTIPRKMNNSTIKKVSGWINERLTSFFIATAEIAKQDLTDIGIDPKNIAVVVNGCERVMKLDNKKRESIRQGLGFAESDFIVGIVARIEKCKNHVGIIEALSRIRQTENGEKIRLLVVGDGSMYQEVFDLASKKLPDTVFVGFSHDVAPYYNIMDLNLNFSVRAETSNLALSEGMSLGIPSVVSDTGGNRFMVKNRENGIVVRENDLKAFGEAIVEIKGSPSLYKKLSDGAFSRYGEFFTAEKMAEQTQKIYRDLYKKRLPH